MNIITKHTIGYNLKRLRKLNGVSQRKLGESIDVSFQQIQKYESGVNRISADTLYKLADILHCNMYEFFVPRSL